MVQPWDNNQATEKILSPTEPISSLDSSNVMHGQPLPQILCHRAQHLNSCCSFNLAWMKAALCCSVKQNSQFILGLRDSVLRILFDVWPEVWTSTGDSPAGSAHASWRACSEAGWSLSPEPFPLEGPRCSWRGACIRWWPLRPHGPLPPPGAGGPEWDPLRGQAVRSEEPRERRQKRSGVRETGSHTGSRAPGRGSLMHPERGWERAPKHS